MTVTRMKKQGLPWAIPSSEHWQPVQGHRMEHLAVAETAMIHRQASAKASTTPVMTIMRRFGRDLSVGSVGWSRIWKALSDRAENR